MKPRILILILAAFILTTCKEENQPPQVEITSPAGGTEYVRGEKVMISANAKDSDGRITEARFFINCTTVTSLASFTFTHKWETAVAAHSCYVILVSPINDGNEEST